MATMSRDNARLEVRRSWRRLIQTMTTQAKSRVNGEASFVCPLCGHGTNGDGLTRNPQSKDGNGLKCFGCGFSGDIIDLTMQTEGISFNDALTRLAAELDIEIEPYKPGDGAGAATTAFQREDGIKTPRQQKTAQRPTQAAQRDFTDYYAQCRARLSDPAAVSYLNGRGISYQTAARYGLGFDPQADPAEAGHPTPRIIMPSTPEHYVARSIDPNTEKRYAKMNNKGGKPGIWNEAALYDAEAQEAFVVEGVFDALSLIEAGAAAVALNSTSNADMLIRKLEQQPTKKTLIVCLDNDEAGRKATERIRQGAQMLKLSFTTAEICGSYKDPNEFLSQDREGFFSTVREVIRQTGAKPDSIGYYIKNIMSDEIRDFRSNVKTGFENLDTLCTGLYSGLYVVAAISSLGKSTFVHQMADQIAAAGTDVLYFSLEMSRLEMVTKSISRITAQKNMETAVTALSIRKGVLTQNVLEASDEYARRAGERMSVVEGNFSTNISFIGDYIRRYILQNDTRPVCMIDYLQILQPEDGDGRKQNNTKQAVDEAVTQLKRLSRAMNLTIIVICSVNRANYLTPIDFESLKESGNIEYGADVIWGLQLHCLTADPVFEREGDIKKKREKVKEAKAETPRKIDVVCLKNRYGVSSYSCSFDYYPAFDLFLPAQDQQENGADQSGRKRGRRL